MSKKLPPDYLADIDRVLVIINACEQPAFRTDGELMKETGIEFKRMFEILTLLHGEGYVHKENAPITNVGRYYSQKGGRELSLNGGYTEHYNRLFSLELRSRRFKILNTVAIVSSIITAIIFGVLNCNSSQRANNNKEEVNRLNNTVELLNRENDSLKQVTQKPKDTVFIYVPPPVK